jgi:hypothetical protein
LRPNRAKLPRRHSATWNGPLPTIGGSAWKVVAASANVTDDQMCSGRIGTRTPSSSVVGAAVVNATVRESMASTEVNPTASISSSP